MASPGIGSARTIVGQNDKMIAGNGISQRVKDTSDYAGRVNGSNAAAACDASIWAVSSGVAGRTLSSTCTM